MPQANRIGVAVVWFGNCLLLQLRDFGPDIDDPGEWGLFGGHLESSEASEAGVRRELAEELGWVPAELWPLGSFAAGDRCIVGYAAMLDVSLDVLVLGEGRDVGTFTAKEIQEGRLYSHRFGRHFPLTDITRRALRLWYGAVWP